MEEFIYSGLRMACPLLFACMGGLFSERAGVINIALEAFMLVGAFAAAVLTLQTGSPYLGFFGGGAVGAGFALIYAGSVIHGRANQVVAGTAMNLLAMGLIPLLLKYAYDSAGGTPAIPFANRFQWFPLWAAFAVAVASIFIMRKTPYGLWVSFVGERPEALDAAGLPVLRIRYSAVVLSGFLAALGGASLSIYLSSGYSRNMVAGRGFMALAALILGKWRPGPAILGCLFFGFMEAIQIRLQSVDFSGGFAIPAQFIVVIPYLATIIVLAGFLGQAKAPSALGTAFNKN
jgi:ABC-type uncharacterized transport system permease subunit